MNFLRKVGNKPTFCFEDHISPVKMSIFRRAGEIVFSLEIESKA